jgi:hypothetical protein
MRTHSFRLSQPFLQYTGHSIFSSSVVTQHKELSRVLDVEGKRKFVHCEPCVQACFGRVSAYRKWILTLSYVIEQLF